ncbi:sugar kinase [Tetragenococcus halophilus]|uniref:sugar kinase n=1 Tax=Tetragenococcus halophilus TaxID=51669 RepID=UPI0015BC7F13|nr:sugar kinase [Tetragenococcus halophilus]NWO00496.1 sugar kinase [Tetragenococcus halophilus]
MSEILTIGEPLVCLASTEKDVSLDRVQYFAKYIGGAELNVATGIKLLGHKVAYVGQLGDDPFGKFIQKELEDKEIDTSYLFQRKRKWTGHQIKQLVSKGDPQVFNYRSDSATTYFDEAVIDNISFERFKFAHLTGIFPALSTNTKQTFEKLYDRLLDSDTFITFDTNLRPDLWSDQETMVQTINKYAYKADIVLPGIDESKILVGSDDPEKISDHYLKNGRAQAVIVKVGAKGAFVKTRAGEQFFETGFKVDEVKDTVGAGDGFAVGVITGLAENLPLRSAVKRGNAIGAMQVQVYGDNNGYPDQQKLIDFYSSR